jgi:toxin HigB-1
MIKTIKHKGLKKFYESGVTSGIQAKHQKKLRQQLTALESAYEIEDMDLPGYKLHPLQGDRADFWSIAVSGNWRLTFTFSDGNVYVLDYKDYH